MQDKTPTSETPAPSSQPTQTSVTIPIIPAPTTTQPELDLADVMKMSQSERLQRLNDLRLKISQFTHISAEECRLGVRLIMAERIARAGGKGGSKEKAAEAKQSFKPVSLSDL